MTITAQVTVSIKNDVLDPAAEALKKSLKQQGINTSDVKIAKQFLIAFNPKADAQNNQAALLKSLAQDFLANPVIEDVRLEFLPENNHG